MARTIVRHSLAMVDGGVSRISSDSAFRSIAARRGVAPTISRRLAPGDAVALSSRLRRAQIAFAWAIVPDASAGCGAACPLAGFPAELVDLPALVLAADCVAVDGPPAPEGDVVPDLVLPPLQPESTTVSTKSAAVNTRPKVP